jgi:tripartite-type tricarboxylate transporter receptor subunit TctC
MVGGGSVVGLAKSGKLKAIAVSSKIRSKELPELPSIGEIYPDYEVKIWHGLFVPKGTPQPVIDKLRAAAHKALASPAVAARLSKSGSGEPFITSPAEFAALMKSDFEKYGALVKKVGLKID